MHKYLLIFLCFKAVFGWAQTEQNNWYFGNGAAISFETGKAVPKYDNPQKIYGPSASISHPVTGKLLFYTDGVNIWNNTHQIIPNGGGISVGSVGGVLIIPDPARPLFYYVFFAANKSLRYVVVDMNQNGGVGYVERGRVGWGDILPQFTAVYHPYKKSFWVIAHVAGNARFDIIEVDSADTLPKSYLQPAMGLVPVSYGDMVVNNAGNKIAVTHYQGHDEQVEVFDFDPICGRVSNRIELDKINSWDHPYGAAFSPDDSKLYITYSIERSQLVQYSGANFENNYLIAEAPDNFNVIRPANDEKLYMATHDGGIPGPRIDAVLEPNKLGVDCKYVKTFLTTDDGTGRFAYFELPAFVSRAKYSGPVQDSLFKYTQTCFEDSTRFTLKNTLSYDSLLWQFGEGTASSTEKNPVYTYKTSGTFVVRLNLYRCGKTFALTDSIRIVYPPIFEFGADTTLCYGSLLTLQGPQADQYKWSTGATTQNIQVTKPGLVWLRAQNGQCASSDSVMVKNFDPIFTALGDHYTICDDDKELEKLDAGEGFEQYKWTPTGDTSQWIIVGNLGDYFVVVKDYRGCNSNDGTKVERRCPVSVFFPNAFTPNNDGVNDVFLPVGSDVMSFKIELYNAWGQKIFESNEIAKGWDGKVNGVPSPSGTYIYKSNYSGYRNKRPVEFVTEGNITLLR